MSEEINRGAGGEFAEARLLDAAVQRLTDPILRLIQNDPHQWSTRPCTTCQTISQLVNKPFGCDYYRLTNSRRI